MDYSVFLLLNFFQAITLTMAELSKQIMTTVFALQQELLVVLNEATTTAYKILEIYGETDTSLIALDDLDNARDRARAYYGRLSTLLERISEAQPFASSAMLELLNRSIDEAQATIAATEATVNEEKRSFDLL
jgi:GTP1/Obg family GTP-binding protein